MYEVRVEVAFSASHQVALYEGGLEPLHGHDWTAEAVFRAKQLDRIDVVIDFVYVRDTLTSITRQLHHTHLNDAPLLAGKSPTAENVARCVHDALLKELGDDTPLAGVWVKEAPGCVAGYWRDPA